MLTELRFTLRLHSERSSQSVWRSVSDTERLNALAGLHFEFVDRHSAGQPRRREAVLRLLGLRLPWAEERYDFERYRQLVIHRSLLRPFRLQQHMELKLLPEDRGTAVELTLRLRPSRAWLLPLLYPVKLMVRWQLQRALRILLREEASAVKMSRLSPIAGGRHSRRQLLEAVGELSDQDFSLALLSHLGRAPLQEQARLSPRTLAAESGISLDRAIAGCADATRLELLHLRLEILCPSCRLPMVEDLTGPSTSPTVTGCPSCELEYEHWEPSGISVRFRPAFAGFTPPSLCLGSPARTPQVLARAGLEPGETLRWALELEPGSYALRVRGHLQPLLLRCSAEAPPAAEPVMLSIRAAEDGLCWTEPPPTLSPGQQVLCLRWQGESRTELSLQLPEEPPSTLSLARFVEHPAGRDLLELRTPELKLSPPSERVLVVSEWLRAGGLPEQLTRQLLASETEQVLGDERLILSVWRELQPALEFLQSLDGETQCTSALAWGPLLSWGAEGAPLGETVESVMRALRASVPGRAALASELDPQVLERTLPGLSLIRSVRGSLELPSLLCFPESRRGPSPAPAPAELQLLGETLLGRYQIKSQLGEGGFGRVYRCWDSLERRSVVMKLLLPAWLSDEELVEQFYREASACARVSHPKVVGVLGFGHTPEGWLYLIMEEGEGLPLSQLLRERGRLSWEASLRLTEDVLEALQAVHDQQLLHRDLKPGNLLVGQRGTQLIDFGLALNLREEQPQPRGLTGTPHYMSPEQLRARPLDPRSDLYAAGLLLHCCLLGGLPGGRLSVRGLVLSRCRAELELREAKDAGLHPRWRALLRKALARDPEDRFDSAQSMREALLKLREQPAFLSSPGDSP